MAKHGESLEILKLLIETREPLSIRQIAIQRKINYKSAYLAIQKLEKENVITAKKIGNTTACVFQPIVHPLIFTAEWERKETFLKNHPALKDRLQGMTNTIVLLFGSYAKHTQDKHSDIDLLVITDSEQNRKLSGLSSKIHINTITFEEFTSMAKTREYSLVSEAMKHNIILTGIEEYYKINAHIRKNKGS
ncbi:MAG: nucleotidyltransferase domain-containing protein [Nanoarchaeota archaeon]